MTGATGNMGFESLQQLVELLDRITITLLVRDSEKNRNKLKNYIYKDGIKIVWGDLLEEELVKTCVQEADLILHLAAIVSPEADLQPQKTMDVNFGGTHMIIQAIKEQKREDQVRFVYIGTVAETGDRMPPLHWGRVGNPIKPSIFDYYAVSKVAAERYVIESGLTYWVSLRQTGIMGKAMAHIDDAIIFHNCLDNVLEYVSERDSGRLIKHLVEYFVEGTLPDNFWGHIYNIGGGASCRVSMLEIYQHIYEEIGFKNLDFVVNPKWYAIRNFHGQYYLDSDRLEQYLHFRQDGVDYFYNAYLERLGALVKISKIICKVPCGQKIMGLIIKKKFQKLTLTEHGTLRFVKEHMEDRVEAYWGSYKKWEEIPERLSQCSCFSDWDSVVMLDHGYDETKPERELSLEDVKSAAIFRGGSCTANTMEKGNWNHKLEFVCAFGHRFSASPRLVLEGGHWCNECERKSWNYGIRATKDPFFAQVWNPLHESTEIREYNKEVSEI